MLISLKNEPIFPLSESLSGISLDMTTSLQAEKRNCASEGNTIKVIPDFMSFQHCSLLERIVGIDHGFIFVMSIGYTAEEAQ
jgi:hypothetical protein